MSYKPSLRTLLICINLVVLLLPVAGIQVLRLYESALVRQTESALIAQGAFVAAFYRALINATGTQNWLDMSRAVEVIQARNDQWRPQAPTLDLAESTVYPPFPDGRKSQTAEVYAASAGLQLMPVLKDAQLTTLAGIRVVDPWGTIIASTGDDVGLNISNAEEVGIALTGQAISRLRSKNEVVEVSALDSISRTSRIRVFVAHPIMQHERLVGAVILSRTPPSIVQALYAKRWLLLQALLFLIALVLLMSILTYRFITKPIAKLADHADLVANGHWQNEQLQQAKTKPRTKEIARLQQAITDMSKTLAQRTQYLQEFARHVSHEFKTPIASIQGAVEVLQDHSASMSTDQQEKFLRNIAADASRLHRLTERLMELTRAEMSLQDLQAVALQSCVAEAASGFSHLAQIDAARVSATANCSAHPEVLIAVLDTLFENAIHHNAQNIMMWSELDTDRLSLYVQDDGSGISPSNQDNIFIPFFTTRREQGGTGLGLTIAKTLMQQIGGDLVLLGGNGPTTFQLVLVTA